ncbi:MAG TPA: XRE family transcriptional regulator [Geobacter sp.]|nr:XRE family transcriptional regulator [Geobacter sp.]
MIAAPKLEALGLRLRRQRLKRNESQAVFASRIGVSIPTLHKMESGDATVQVGHWMAALDILDRTEDIDALLSETDLFDLYEKQAGGARKRASRKVS